MRIFIRFIYKSKHVNTNQKRVSAQSETKNNTISII